MMNREQLIIEGMYALKYQAARLARAKDLVELHPSWDNLRALQRVTTESKKLRRSIAHMDKLVYLKLERTNDT
jgi:hypothetical protein